MTARKAGAHGAPVPTRSRRVPTGAAGAGRGPVVDARFRLRITRGEDIAVGPGKVDLLEAIAQSGSITAAARALGMSYRRAWLLVDAMNRAFRGPVVAAESGGTRGGGTALTLLGREVVARYRAADAAAQKAAAREIAALAALLRKK